MAVPSITIAPSSLAPLPYFLCSSLKQQFVRDLTDALLAGRIDEQERQWLSRLVDPPSGVPDADPPRVDRLVMDDASPSGTEMTAAMLISHESTPDARVYLATILYGLERFADRQHLLATMQHRFESRGVVAPVFDAELIEGEVFEKRMLAIIDQQVAQIGQLAEQLEQLPSLTTALDRALRQQLELRVPGQSINPATWLLHLTETVASGSATQPAPKILGVQSLLDAALDDFSAQVLGAGQARSFLDPEGRALSPVQSQPYHDVLSGVTAVLAPCFQYLLDDYWQFMTPQGMTRRALAERSSTEYFRQQILVCRQRGDLDRQEFEVLRGVLPFDDESGEVPGRPRIKNVVLVNDDEEVFDVAGMVLLDLSTPDVSSLLVYSAVTGLRHFDNLIALQEYFETTTGRAELLQHVSPEAYPAVLQASLSGLSSAVLVQPLFAYLMDSVIALQKRNLTFVLSQPHLDRERSFVVIDDALDVFRLIDRRLTLLTGSSRWRDRSLTEEGIEQSRPEDSGLFKQSLSGGTNAIEQVSPMPSWLELLRDLDAETQRVGFAHPAVRACARDLLNLQLSVFADERLDADRIYLTLGASAVIQEGSVMSSTISLNDVLLERVTRYRLDDVPHDSQVFVDSPEVPPVSVGTILTPALINQMLKRAHGQFPARYLQALDNFFTRPFRKGGVQFDTRSLSADTLHALLRIQIGIEERVGSIDAHTLGMLEQVLDRPEPSMRELFKDDRVEVFTLRLKLAADSPAVPMNDAFILNRPRRADSPLVFWSPLKGLRVFGSSAALERYLNSKLANPAEREQWLKLLNEGDDALMRQWLLRSGSNRVKLQTLRIDINFFDFLTASGEQLQRNCINRTLRYAGRCQLDASLFEKLMSFAGNGRRLGALLDGLTIAIQRLIFEAFIPDWLKAASTQDLTQYADVLTRYYLTNDPVKDFLVDIPRLPEYARDRLISQLGKDFPGQVLDPDTIRLTLTRYVPTPVAIGQTPSMVPAITQVDQASLTEYAINHFSVIQSAQLAVVSTDNSTVAAQLTPAYLRQLVRTLDIGAGFQQMLAQKLDERAPDYAIRQSNFVRQTPASMLELAFEYKFEKLLSETGFEFIQNMIEMPDSVARQPVRGQEITLRPLQLLAAPYLEPDTVLGLYVIGPKDLALGPVVLYALFHQGFSFKEYAGQDALLEDIRTSSSLQGLILGRVATDVRKRYDHGGFMEPHLPWSTESLSDVPLSSPGPVSLVVEPVQGSVLQYLFVETLAMLKSIARKQAVTTAEADWQSFVYLMTLGAEQVLTFLPGKLGMLVAAWQSHSWFKASVTAASHRRWGKAFSEFSAALSVLITSRQEQAFEDKEALTAEMLEPDTEFQVSEPRFSWGNDQQTPELKARLQTFETGDVSLKDLDRDELYNLYQSPGNHKTYAVVAGKVYEVRQDGTQWRIADGTQLGPRVKLNELQQWELDLGGGLRGGGGLLTRFKIDETELEVEQVMVVEATGMVEIRQMSRDKARRIGQAHLQAKEYLDTCLENLNATPPHAGLDERSTRIIEDFFGVDSADDGLILRVKHSMTSVFNALLDASLSPFSSSRYVVGFNKAGHERTTAFTVKEDPLQRIFLTERFFNVPEFQLKSRESGQPSFNLNAHYRATTLIHEISHLANDTHDIAYLESSAPYLDLMVADVPHQVRLIEDLKFMQQSHLSHQTPRGQLFQVFERGRWRDLNDMDGGGKALILKITGCANLEQARDVFLNNAEKRSAIMLGNADSLTMLASLLGRQRFTGA